MSRLTRDRTTERVLRDQILRRERGRARKHSLPCLDDHEPTIGEGGDATISSPGRSPKHPHPGIRLHDPLHGRQACPEFIAFDQRVRQICPGRGYFRAVSSQNGDKYVTSPPPLNRWQPHPVDLYSAMYMGWPSILVRRYSYYSNGTHPKGQSKTTGLI